MTFDDPIRTAGDVGEGELDEAEHRRRIMLSIAAGLLAVLGLSVPIIVVLVGRTSSASFADAEVLSANQLGAAVLDIEIEATPERDGGLVGSRNGSDAATGEALFTAFNLAPGDRVSGQLEMTNSGDLTLRYGLDLIGDRGQLGQWLRFEVWAGTGICSPDQPGPRVIQDVRLGSEPVALVDLIRPDEANVLRAGESFLWCVGAVLPLDTPNEAQGERLEMTMVVTAEHLIEEQP